MNIKSERLKKLETELHDLEHWLKLGLVPKKDLDKHKEEIKMLQDKVEEEKQRLRFLKESGEMEEFTLPKRQTGRQNAHEPHSLPDVDIGDEGFTETGFDMETEPFDLDTSASGEDASSADAYGDDAGVEEEEDPFSDRNRWKRGVFEDPDANDW